jgi:myo-inositol-1(or 4)-monophosphatase
LSDTKEPKFSKSPVGLDLDQLLECALDAANNGAAELLRRFGGELNIQSKSSPEDHVTDADLAAETIVRAVISKHRPEDAITGEELEAKNGSNALVRWSIDPLDGTVNYTRGLPHFATSVGAASTETGQWLVGAVVAPKLGVTYFAKKGGGAWKIEAGQTTQIFGPPKNRTTRILATGFSYSAANRAEQIEFLGTQISNFVDVRRLGSAALDACLVADGTLDAYYELHTKEYDWAAGLLIAEEAGQSVKRSDFEGDLIWVNAF